MVSSNLETWRRLPRAYLMVDSFFGCQFQGKGRVGRMYIIDISKENLDPRPEELQAGEKGKDGGSTLHVHFHVPLVRPNVPLHQVIPLPEYRGQVV